MEGDMTMRNQMAVGFALIMNATPSWSQDISAGVYEGERGTLRVTVDGSDIGVTVKTPGCLGSVEGFLARNDAGQLFMVSSNYKTDSCAIAIQAHGKSSFSTRQGPECSYNHGAACSFDGFVERVR
jgi:hypothetical protein